MTRPIPIKNTGDQVTAAELIALVDDVETVKGDSGGLPLFERTLAGAGHQGEILKVNLAPSQRAEFKSNGSPNYHKINILLPSAEDMTGGSFMSCSIEIDLYYAGSGTKDRKSTLLINYGIISGSVTNFHHRIFGDFDRDIQVLLDRGSTGVQSKLSIYKVQWFGNIAVDIKSLIFSKYAGVFLDDSTITPLINSIAFDDGTAQATRATSTEAAITTLGLLPEVDISTTAPIEGDVLVNRSGTFVPEAPAGGGASVLDELTDVNTTTTAPIEGDVLVNRSGVFVPEAPSGGGGATALDELTDVNTTTTAPIEGDVLVNRSGVFVPEAPAGGGSIDFFTDDSNLGSIRTYTQPEKHATTYWSSSNKSFNLRLQADKFRGSDTDSTQSIYIQIHVLGLASSDDEMNQRFLTIDLWFRGRFTNSESVTTVIRSTIKFSNANHGLTYYFSKQNNDIIFQIHQAGDYTWASFVVTKIIVATHNKERLLASRDDWLSGFLVQNNDFLWTPESVPIDVTPAVVNSGSNANGYWRKWDDGHIEQWGETASLAGDTSAALTFPIAYSDLASIMVTADQSSNTNTSDYNLKFTAKTTSTFTIRPGYWGGTFYWRSIGK